MSALGFRIELEKLINRESMENGSNTPDFVLCIYLEECLRAFDAAVVARERYFGRDVLSLHKSPAPETKVACPHGKPSENECIACNYAHQPSPNGGMKPTCPNCGHEPCADWCGQHCDCEVPSKFMPDARVCADCGKQL